MPKCYRALGAMSGTSMDGIDLALLETDGHSVTAFGPTAAYPFAEEDRALLREAVAAAKGLRERDARPGVLAEAEKCVTRRHIEAINSFLANNGLDPRLIDVIGFHGQTVLHRPEWGMTVQIGRGEDLARALGIDVAHDLRAADMRAGGQGAPLVPIYHRALAETAGVETPALFVNIGGVANFTYLAPGVDPIACDTGPGNALLDDLMLERTGVAIDRDGACAAAGAVDEAALARLMAHAYFLAPPPKSLDRNAFSAAPVAELATEDAAATLTAFTAASIVAHLAFLPEKPRVIVVCGGGARNPSLLRALSERSGCDVRRAEDFGWSAEAVEAQAFAFLAVRSVRGLPLTFPGTTGVAEPTRGGLLAWAG